MASLSFISFSLSPSQPRKHSESAYVNGTLKPITIIGSPPTFVSAPGRRIIAIGDLHGDLAQTRSALEMAGVLSSDGPDSWIGGGTVLVQLGDILDRGEDEIAILSLLRSLDIQAKSSGGAVFQMLQRAKIDSRLDASAKRWNSEYVKMKFLQGEIKKKYLAKVKELENSEALVEECREEITLLATKVSHQQEAIDRARGEVFEKQLELDQVLKDLEIAKAEKLSLGSVYEKKLKELAGANVAVEESRVIEEFKKSFAFKALVQDRVEEAREEIYATEVKSLESQSLDEGLLRGFLKGIRLVHRRTGALIDDLSFSQISEDSSRDSDDDDADSTQPVIVDSDVDVV